MKKFSGFKNVKLIINISLKFTDAREVEQKIN